MVSFNFLPILHYIIILPKGSFSYVKGIAEDLGRKVNMAGTFI
jgi:hypothetical protein